MINLDNLLNQVKKKDIYKSTTNRDLLVFRGNPVIKKLFKGDIG
jgi:hypothetical protein